MNSTTGSEDRAIREYNIIKPITKRQIRAFLGYYCKFVSDYASPLTDMTQKNKPCRQDHLDRQGDKGLIKEKHKSKEKISANRCLGVGIGGC